MELSEETQRGLHRLADPVQFSPKAFSAVLRAAFHSLIQGPAAQSALDDTGQSAPSSVKECHTALATCILEAVKHNADRATLSSFLEDCKFDKERTEELCTEYQKHKAALETLLDNIGRCPPHVSDVSWSLAYGIKSNQLHKTYRPSYYVKFRLETSDARQPQDVRFHCSMEQLQDLVGKLKDAAKSLERTSQM